MRTSPKEFSVRLRKVMDDHKLSAVATERISGISARTIEKWLTGDTFPRADKLALVADALGTPIEWLVSGEEQDSRISENRKALIDYIMKLSEERVDALMLTLGIPVNRGKVSSQNA